MTRFRLTGSAAAVAALVLAASPAAAQQQDEQLWLQLNTNVPITDDVRLTLEQVARLDDGQGGLYQTEFGGILGYRVAHGIELGFGYRKVGSHNLATAPDEDRLRQHIVATFGAMLMRLRLDERFIPQSREVGLRFRPLIRYNHQLGDKGYALFVSHESFILPNSTSWGQLHGYERMRNIVGVTVPFGKLVSADVGYLNQYRLARGGARAQMDHALTVQLTINVAPHHAPKADD